MSKKTVRAMKLNSDKSVKPTPAALGVPAGTLKLSALGAKVKATLGRTNSMDELELCLVNSGSRVANVELTGTVLLPSDGSHQRLFVAGDHDVAQPTVRIPAGKEVKVRLATCCMDQSLRTPAEGVEYSISKDVAPERDIHAARNWINARKFLAGDAGTGFDISKFALQGDYVGHKAGHTDDSKARKKEAKRKSTLSYVQDVCWAQCEP